MKGDVMVRGNGIAFWWFILALLLSITLTHNAKRQLPKKEMAVKIEAKDTAKIKAQKAEIKAIVICCSDPRFDMFDRIREHYGFGRGECFPIVVPGGPDPLANPILMDYKCQAEKIDLDIILKHPAPSMKIVIIAEHEDCACIKHYGFTDLHQGKKDFLAIKKFFGKRAPQLEIEMLYYSFSDRDKGLVNPIPEEIKLD